MNDHALVPGAVLTITTTTPIGRALRLTEDERFVLFADANDTDVILAGRANGTLVPLSQYDIPPSSWITYVATPEQQRVIDHYLSNE